MTPEEIQDSRARLDAEAAEYRERKLSEGHAEEIERMESASNAAGMSRVVDLGAAVAKELAAFARMQEKWTTFCATIRPAFDELPEHKACPHHPSVMRPKLFEETCQRSRMEDAFTAAWAPCGECQGADAKAKQRQFWSKRGVPQRVIDATLSNFTADIDEKVVALGKVAAWIKREGVFLLLAGTTGTGKGHLATGCLKAQGNGLFITHADMLSDLRASYTLHTTKDAIATWQEAEMLVLDEFGLSPGGKDEEPMLYQVLADRYDKRRPTIITSNLDLTALREAIGFRLLDRMTEDCATVICKWDSHRKAGK